MICEISFKHISSQLRSKFYIPTEFFVKNGLRLSKVKSFENGRDNFKEALRHIPESADEFLVSCIRNNQAYASSMSTYSAWLFSHIESNEAVESLHDDFDFTTIEATKNFIRHLQMTIKCIQGTEFQLDGSFDDAIWKYGEALESAVTDEDKATCLKLQREANERKKKKTSVECFKPEFVKEILDMNKEVKKLVQGDVEEAHTQWKLLAKVFDAFLKSFGNDEQLSNDLEETVVLISKQYHKQRNFSAAKEILEENLQRFPFINPSREVYERVPRYVVYDSVANGVQDKRKVMNTTDDINTFKHERISVEPTRMILLPFLAALIFAVLYNLDLF